MPAPLPIAVSILDMPGEIMSDAIAVWDFLNMFAIKLRLSPFEIEDFFDLLRFTRRPTTALTEVCCSLLRLILSDSHLALKLSNSIPKTLNFAYRGVLIVTDTDSASSSIDSIASLANSKEDNVDTGYNGLKLMPRKLQPELVDPLRWQAVLRCILLRLPPAKTLRKAVSIYDTEMAKHATKVLSPESMKMQLHKLDVGNDYSRATSATEQDGARNSVDRDALFNVCSDPRMDLANLMQAADELQLKEFHELSAVDKVVVLKVLCDACYDTECVRTLVEQNAEARVEKRSALNKLAREEQAKKKDVSLAKRNQAIEMCRMINMEAAMANPSTKKKGPASVLNASLTDNSQNPSSSSDRGETTKKIKGKEKDPYYPSQLQLQSMLDEIIMLDTLGIDVVLDIPPDIPPDGLEQEDSSNNIPLDFLDTKQNMQKRRR